MSQSNAHTTTQLSLESLQTDDESTDEVVVEHIEAAADEARAQLPPSVREKIPSDIPAERIGPKSPGEGITPNSFRDGIANPEINEEYEPTNAFELSDKVTSSIESICAELDAVDHERRQANALEQALNTDNPTPPEFEGVLPREWLDIFRRHAQKLENREPVIIVTPYCWFIYGMDASNVTYYELYIPREAWTEYSCTDTGITAFSWDAFTRLITAVNDNEIKLSVSSNNSTTLDGHPNLCGKITISEQTTPASVSFGAIEPTRQRVPDFGDGLNFDAEINAENGQTIVEALETATNQTEHITLYTTEEGISTTEETSDDTNDLLIDTESPRIDYSYSSDSKTTNEGVLLSASHLNSSLSKLLKSQQQTPITLRLRHDTPIEITFNFDAGAHLRSMLAPRHQ
ncbi:hypothetical protein [Salinibaculum rarum]|uniref:hypothetical protein n=1 Tax=Salinibaculum rarum TaxID=3058903 RepID=UPI00265F23FB|nr:hypothetical protein [Salinibaculum sp. KK48]